MTVGALVAGEVSAEYEPDWYRPDSRLDGVCTPTTSAYPLRVVLRFLCQLDPPLLAGQRGRYSLAMESGLFEKQAMQAWGDARGKFKIALAS